MSLPLSDASVAYVRNARNAVERAARLLLADTNDMAVSSLKLLNPAYSVHNLNPELEFLAKKLGLYDRRGARLMLRCDNIAKALDEKACFQYLRADRTAQMRPFVSDSYREL